MNNNIRQPIVAGQFYPAAEYLLKNELQKMVNINNQPIEAKAIIMPHAGYVYSGKVAGKTVSSIRIKDTVILIGPNHRGYGKEFSIVSKGIWKTPIGDVAIEENIAKNLIKNCSLLEEDELAHRYEHSLEVQLPFLKYLNDKVKIIPIVIGCDDSYKLDELSSCIVQTIKRLNIENEILLLASSDMTHYESERNARKKDKLAIEAILKLDENLLMERVKKFNISMCGAVAVYIILKCAKELNAQNVKLIKYQTSADVNLDKSSVVGYAGIVIF